jgi:broad specificity phosphatase PhoE
MNLFFVRHGQSTGNVAGRLQGWRDLDLTPAGEQQAEKTGAFLARYTREQDLPIAAIYSSDLRRARRTAEALGRHLGLPVQPEPGLRELHFGVVEGLTGDEIKARFPDQLHAWEDQTNYGFGWPGGETRGAFYARIQATVTRLMAGHPPTANLLLVSHGGVIGSYLALLEHGEPSHWMRFPIGNCSISRVEWTPGDSHPHGVACILATNDAAHLADDLHVLG